MVSKPQDSIIRRVHARSVLHDGRRQHCGKLRRENVDQVDVGWNTSEENDFPGGKRPHGTQVSLEDGEEWKQSSV